MTKLARNISNMIEHPVTKRLSLAIPIAVFVGLIRSWWGFEQSALIGFASGIAAYLIAVWFFLSSDERKGRIQKSFEYLKDNSAFVVKYCVLIFLIVFFFSAHEKPSDPLLSQIQQMVEVFALLAVLILPVFRVIVDGGYLSIAYYTGRVISGIAAYSVVLWMIGQYGVDTKEWIISNPNEAAITGVSFLLVWFILKFSTGLHYSYTGNIERRSASASMAVIGVLPKPTERDNKYTAAHESGHALVYASLGCLPPRIELVIKDNGGTDGSLGYISGINSDHQLNEKTFSEWLMLVLLAGKIGETFAFGTNTLGSANDHRRWLELARSYLSNHFDGIFYADPQNRFEQEKNEEKLEDLQRQQRAMLEKLFSENAEVFENLSNALLKKKRLGRDDLIPFLSQVHIPKGFPLPLGDFDKFNNEWPKDIGLYTNND